MKVTWEVTGSDWVGLRYPAFYHVFRFVHKLAYPNHPDYNGGGY